MTEPTDSHDYEGAWYAIFLVFAVLFTFTIGTFMLQDYQIDVIYDRVGEMQRQLDCPPGELLVADHDGVEYCLASEESE
ncbi:hypothetical protein LCGC14_1590540 [marine sediment metagenome]|uniref:Uncharacterized protein n=1 Tax=marine sediment metagenome TaxID=412755 RepID=A0A0F9IE07_9ZZZZ